MLAIILLHENNILLVGCSIGRDRFLPGMVRVRLIIRLSEESVCNNSQSQICFDFYGKKKDDTDNNGAEK